MECGYGVQCVCLLLVCLCLGGLRASDFQEFLWPRHSMHSTDGPAVCELAYLSSDCACVCLCVCVCTHVCVCVLYAVCVFICADRLHLPGFETKDTCQQFTPGVIPSISSRLTSGLPSCVAHQLRKRSKMLKSEKGSQLQSTMLTRNRTSEPFLTELFLRRAEP